MRWSHGAARAKAIGARSPQGVVCTLALLALGCSSSPSAALFEGVNAGLPTGSATISTVDLVASYDMSTLTHDGRLQDFGPNGLHGTLAPPLGLAAPFGQARDFSDVALRVHLPEDPAFDLNGPLTIAAWVRVDEGSLHQHIVACDDKWALWITPDDRYRLGDTRGGGWSTPPGTVETGVWTAVVAVLEVTAGEELTEDVAALFVDGERIASERHMRTVEAQARTTWGPGDLYPSDACYIGFESHQGNEAHQTMPFVGAVDELIIAGRAWTADEVAAFSTPPS